MAEDPKPGGVRGSVPPGQKWREPSYTSLTSPEERVRALTERNRKLAVLLDVARAMTYERDFDALLDMILTEAIKVVDAERGSLFIADHKKDELWSKIAKGLGDESKIIRFPIGTGIAGHVARSGESLNIPDAYADERFNPAFDQETGFKTNTILCVPMLGRKDEVVGVLQVLNHAKGTPFTAEDEALLMAFGSNAAAAIENANLYDSIETLFDGFVEASVTAIEARDPTTSGHSFRVADLCCTLMELVPRSDGIYRNMTFNKEQMREMRYAALLHDFGKVGVREHVLVKADKLYPHELELLEERFEQARRAAEIRMLEAKVDTLATYEKSQVDTRIRQIHDEWKKRDEHFREMLEFIRKCNRPTVLESGGFEKLQEIAAVTFSDGSGTDRPLLTDAELQNLSIARGSLNGEERLEIESHVVHTYNFLRKIPWTRSLSNVPLYAKGHHEKLDGSGYPHKAPADLIPIQTRIMTISDIYDALTAADRPYKPAMPHERALTILEHECKAGKLDADLLRLFIEARVPERALNEMRSFRETDVEALAEHGAHEHTEPAKKPKIPPSSVTEEFRIRKSMRDALLKD